MNIDERLERLTDRHEALSQSLELLSHDIDALRAAQGETIETVRRLAVIADQNETRAGKMMDAIARLARVADIHENRLAHLEGTLPEA
jgi:prefoldin subunit 5